MAVLQFIGFTKIVKTELAFVMNTMRI